MEPKKVNIMNSSVFKNISILILFSIIGFLIYSNTLESPFILDDEQNIKENTDIRINEITIGSLVKVVFKNGYFSKRPVSKITFALNYYFHQYNLKGYHVVNIIIHVLSSILLYFFIRITLITPALQSKYNNPEYFAFFAAMVWMVHPLHTQSVTYIVQRMSSMSAMFYLLSMLFYVTGRMHLKKDMPGNSQSKTRGSFFFSTSGLYFLGAVLAWLLALGSKQSAAALPVFIFLYEWYFFRDLDRTWLKRNMKKNFTIVVLIGLTSLFILETAPLEHLRSINDFSNHEFTFMERVFTQPRVVIYYLSLLFYPHPSRLNLDYDFPLSNSLVDPLTTLFSIFVIAGLIWFAVCMAKKERLLSFCILWFFGNLIIESSVIPLAVIFEHRTYLPSMLICLLMIITGHRYIKFKGAGVIFVCIVTAVFSFWTYQRNMVWSDFFTLWSDCVKKSPQKARPHISLGVALQEQGYLDDAVKHYEKALNIDNEDEMAHYNLGIALKKQGRTEDSIKHYMEAVHINPDYGKAHYNLGNAIKKQGRLDDAVKHYMEVLRIDPDYERAYFSLGIALKKQGRVDEAIKHYRKAVRLKPDHMEAHYNLGNALQEQGHVDDAIEHYLDAVRIRPNFAKARNNLGNALLSKGDIDGAIEHIQKALQIDPDYINAQTKLKRALAMQKQGQ